ncbi:MAG: RidA family protein [bacterium]|jgi:enamine deaminase RidA (YjgF/YER057c/UK114 family)|nr:RidA family protein [bacterium]
MRRVEEVVRGLGLELPKTPYRKGLIPVKRDGHLLYVSGQGPTVDGTPQCQGKVGAEVSLEEGYKAAQLCGLNALSALRDFLGGDLDRVTGVLKVLGLVASAPDFYRQPEVVDGFSDLMVSIWGENGRHARSAVGVAALPNNIPVEVEMVVALRED